MKTTKTTKTVTTVRRNGGTVTVRVRKVATLCAKCGRDNRRAAGVSGDCRNTTACKTRQTIVAEAIAAGASL